MLIEKKIGVYNGKKTRNGEIDLLRFLFAVSIMAFHFTVLGNSYFIHGHIGVEFFFLVTGYLMNQSSKKITKNYLILVETKKFIVNKVLSFYIYYIMAYFLNLLVKIKGERWSLRTVCELLCKSIPDLTCTYIILKTDNPLYITGSWYLSAMVIALVILYPILLYFKEGASKFLFPLGGIFILGHLLYQNGCITEVWSGKIPAGVLRAMAEIAIGCFLYEVVEMLKKQRFKKGEKIVLNILKIFCYIIVFTYSFGIFLGRTDSDIHIFLILCIAITITFSEIGYCLPGSKFTNYIGKLSFVIYILHGTIIYILQLIFGNEISITILIVSYIISILFSSLFLCIVNIFIKCINYRTIIR